MTPNRSSPPKRPLSAYNLFYRYKRAKIIEVNGGSGKSSCTDKKYICQLVAMTPGLENYPLAVHGMIPNEVRRTNIRSALNGQLFARDTKYKRTHRKSSHGYKMSFVELNKIMVDSWKHTDAYSKSVFQELAEDGREEHNQQLDKYRKDALRRMNLNLEDTSKPRNFKFASSSPSKDSLALSSLTKIQPVLRTALRRSEQCDFSFEPLPFGQILPAPSQVSHPMMEVSASLSLAVKLTQSNHQNNSLYPGHLAPPAENDTPARNAENSFTGPFQPLPFHLGTEGSNSYVSMSSFQSSSQSKCDRYRNNVSADDFMELIATLSES